MIFLATSAPAMVVAEEIHWASGVSGNWNDSTKWTGGVIPGASDTAVIDPAGTYTVTLNVNPTVAGLTLGGASGTQTLSMSGRTLTLNGAGTVTANGALILSNSTINGTGSLTNAGQLSASAAILDVALVNDGTMTAQFACGGCAFSATLNSTFTNNGLVNLMGGENLLIANNGWDNYGSAQSLAGTNVTAVVMAKNGTLINQPGAFLRSNGAALSTFQYKGNINNLGTIEVFAPFLHQSGGGTGYLLDSTVGTLDVDSIWTSGGGSGEFRIGGSTTLSGGGTIRVQGILSLDSDFTQPALPQFDFTTGAVTVQAVTPATPTYTIGPGASLQLYGDTINVPLINDGTMTAQFACGGCSWSATLNSAFTNNGLVNLMGGENLLIPNNGLDNYGTIESLADLGPGASITATIHFWGGPGTLTNHLGGTLRSNGSATSNMHVRGFGADVVNEGLIDAQAPISIESSAGAFAVDSTNGTMNVNATLTFAGGSTDLRIGGSTTLSGGGAIRVQGTLSLDSDFTQPVLLQFDFTTGAVTVRAVAPATPTYTIATGATLQLNGTIFNIPLVNNGTLTAAFSCGGCNPSAILNSNFTNNGLVNLMGGENLRIPTNDWDNYGTIESLAPAGATASVIGWDSLGVLTNHMGATLRSNGSSTSNMVIDAFDGVINEGVIDVVAPMSFDSGGVDTLQVDSTEGTMNVNALLSFASNSIDLRIGGATVLTGGGTIRLGQMLSLDSDFTQPVSPLFDFLGTYPGVTVQALAPAMPTYTMAPGATAQLNGTIFNIPLVNNGTLTAAFSCGGCNPSAILNSNFTNNGLVNLMGGQNLRIPNNGWECPGDVSLFENATLQYAASGTMHFAGTTDIAAGKTLTISSGTIHIDNGVVQGGGSCTFGGGLLHGYGQVAVPFSASNADIDAHDGALTIGSAGSPAGVSIRALDVGSETVTLLDSNGPTLGGNITISGGTLVSASGLTLNSGRTLTGFGTLQANTVNNGTITVGSSPGILNVAGNYTQGAGGVLNMELGGLVVGTEYDRLAQSQNGPPASATLGGTLNISRFGLYVPVAGNVFTILTASARLGTFATVNGLNMPCTTTLAITYHPTEVRLTASGGCNDSNACSDDVCNPGPGTCSFPANYNTATDCCNPANGSVTTITDDNVCTADSCNSSNGVVTYTDLTPPGFCCAPLTGHLTPIDDEVLCTDDQCNPDGSVDHFDNCATGLHCNTATSVCVECLQDADCPAAEPFCDLSDNDCNECLDDSVCLDTLYCEVDRGYCVPLPLDPDLVGDKCRFISFYIPAENAADTALRVRLVSLHHVVPPYTGGPSIPFTSFEGQVRWVGPPASYVESTANPTPFFASSLQCTPHYRDWTTVGLLHTTGSAITPSSFFQVENVAAQCIGQEATCTAVSNPLGIGTRRWGDVETPYSPPNPGGQPDFADVSSLVNKFRSAPGSPIKARALLAGDDAFGNISPSTIAVDYSFAHISACVDAFRGKAYPHTMIEACP